MVATIINGHLPLHAHGNLNLRSFTTTVTDEYTEPGKKEVEKGTLLGKQGKYTEAIRWYKKALKKGNAMTYRQMAVCYHNGQG